MHAFALIGSRSLTITTPGGPPVRIAGASGKKGETGWLLEEKKEPDSSLSPSSGPRRQVADDRTGASHLRIKLEDRLSSLLRLKSPNCVQEQKTPSSSRQDCPSRPAMFPKRVSYRSGRLVTSPNTTDHFFFFFFCLNALPISNGGHAAGVTLSRTVPSTRTKRGWFLPYQSKHTVRATLRPTVLPGRPLVDL